MYLSNKQSTFIHATMNESEAMHEYCQDWNLTFETSFHFGNVFLGLGYVLPQIFTLSLMGLRALITLGYILLFCWSLHVICALDIFIYNTLFLLINSFYFLHLAKKHFPVFIPSQQKEIYAKIFQPLKVSKKEFRALVRDSNIETIRAGKSLTIENETSITPKLRILISGRLTVKCDDIFLHFVHPMEFIDSVEWRSRLQPNPPKLFQVSMDAVYDSKYLCLPTSNLEKVFAENSSLMFVMRCLVGKDVARKLYIMNENVYNLSHKDPQRRGTTMGHSHMRLLHDFHRTNSADAINTGCRGHVRSKHWVDSSALKEASDGEQLVVLNFELDVPPPMTYLPHNVPIHSIDRSTMAEAQFIAQQRKYWPTGIL